MTISQWADSERILSPEASAEPGQWVTDKAPFQRGMMDAFNDKRAHTLAFMTSAQIGKTEIINNVLGYLIDKDPCPILVVQPTLDMAEAWSKDRLAPMVRDTPALRGRVSEHKRDGENTILHKKFPGGHLTVSGANSPASLASRPIRVVLLDEVDRFPLSAGKEGDPANLAIKRTTTFWNKKIMYVSTPTIKDNSRIAAAYEASDQRVYKVPCPHCHEYQVLSFWQIKRPYEDAPPWEWEYVCSENGCIIEEHHKPWMLKNGFWEAQKPFRGIAGFHISEVYSPWVSWVDMVENFLEMKKLPDTLKTFINTSLAELWDEEKEGDGVTPESVLARTETYDAEAPEGVYVITAGVDVQDDRIEIEFLGWGLDRETWSLAYVVKHGDPGIPEIWDELEDLLDRTFVHKLGIPMKAQCVCIDSGGHHTESVYKFAKKMAARKKRIYAIKGSNQRGQPIIAKMSKNPNYKIRLFHIGTDTAKDMIYSQLRLDRAGPGYMHHPDVYDEEYFNQLTAEKKKTVYEKGRTVTKWSKPSSKRNEALDCKVYNFAAFWILKSDMQKVRINFMRKVTKMREQVKEAKKLASITPHEQSNNENKPVAQRRTPTRKARKGSSYVKGWNKL